MRLHALSLTAFLALTTLTISASAQTSDLKFTHATVYTTPDQPPIHDATILIHNGKITAVGPTASIKAPPAAHHAYDCTGMTITAGFWNSHVHFLPPQLLHADEQIRRRHSTHSFKPCSRAGASPPSSTSPRFSPTPTYIRSRIAAGKRPGPAHPHRRRTLLGSQRHAHLRPAIPRRQPHRHAGGPPPSRKPSHASISRSKMVPTASKSSPAPSNPTAYFSSSLTSPAPSSPKPTNTTG